MRSTIMLAVFVFLAPVSSMAQVHGTAEQGGRINQLKVLSDKIDDVTTVENTVKSFIRPGMSDQKRAEALWRPS